VSLLDWNRRRINFLDQGVAMRYIQAFVFLTFLVAIGVFAAQNTGVIRVNFLNWNLSQPVALLSVAVYVLGMLSGWTVLAFMRGSFRRVTQRPGH
jgi:putative membrane protein